LVLDRTQQPGFAHQLVKQALLSDKLLRCIEFLDLAVIEHDDAVTVQNGVDAVRNCVSTLAWFFFFVSVAL